MLDGTTVGALLGFLGLVVTALSGVYVATRTSSSEKESAAQRMLEDTRDEATEARFALRDERIAFLEQQLADERAKHQNCKEH